MSRKANLFVVGAMKAGTTSFVEMLSQHPQIYMSPIKEPHYFVENLPKSIYSPPLFFSLERYFEKDFPKPLHIAQLNKIEHYEKLFSMANSDYKYLAEASTGYLNDPGAAQNIYNYNPNAKIIILLRDPLKRAFSHYKMDLGLGRTKATFQQEIDKEIKDYNNGVLSNWSYIGMSLYDGNVERYLAKFEKNVLILNLKNLGDMRETTVEEISKFLGVSKFNCNLKYNNVSRTLRFQNLLFFLKQSGLKDILSWVLPQWLRYKIFRLLAKRNGTLMNLEEDTLIKVNRIFNKENIKQKDKL